MSAPSSEGDGDDGELGTGFGVIQQCADAVNLFDGGGREDVREVADAVG